MYVHPATHTWPGAFPPDYDFAGEFAALVDPAVRAPLRDSGVQPVTFSELCGARSAVAVRDSRRGTFAGTAAGGIAIPRSQSLAYALSRAPRRERGGFEPPSPYLKPLHGDEPGLYENLRSFCEQEYRRVSDHLRCGRRERSGAERRAPLAARISAAATSRSSPVARAGARNPKDRKSARHASASAKHQLIVIADSDMRVGRDYLSRVIAAAFADPDVRRRHVLYGGDAAARTPRRSSARCT